MSSREIELAWLIHRIHHSEALIARAYQYFYDYNHLWSKGVSSYFLDMLERKKDQLYYEKHRAEKLGWLIAGGRDAMKMDI
jgi:hypothetical protein